jgi:hypothetical protein
MGWWGTKVMSGDSPLDYEGDFAKMMGLEFQMSGKQSYIFTRPLVEKHLKEMVAKAEKDKYDGKTVGLHVIGVIALRVGAKLPKNIKDKILKACDDDEWMREDGTSSERGASILRFRKAVEDHKPGVIWKEEREYVFGKKAAP